jgi:glutamate-ammonia-ligase adenylyltransferase
MTFASRLTRQPIAHDPDAEQDMARAFVDLPPDLVGLLAGAAGCSPYLKGLMTREGDWLRAALDMGPESACADVFAALPQVALADLPVALRQAKRRIALMTALADLGGVWPLETVTQTLTRLADLAVDLSMQRLVAEEIRRGKLPGQTPEDAATAAGMVALAMGKMGAGELNYSSDIDLICLFDETRYPGTDAQEARAAFIRVTRKMTAIISDITSEGYVFRLDLRLRPDASVTPVCLSMAAAESYYESVGRTWERAAYIKARACGGDIAAGDRFVKTLTPFVWRKHLDFAAIQDAHDMRLRIRDHKGLSGPIVLEGHNMKLGIGGIREIEFFTQTRQLIAGGRDPDLRDRTTVGGLAALAAKGWIPHDTAQDLTDLYRHHREVEHRLQMVQDAQTQLMPASPDGIARIARFCGEGDTARFRATLRARLDRVADLTESFFAPAEAEAAPDLTPAMAQTVEGWRNLPALRSSRAQDIFKRLRPLILRRMMRATNPPEALSAFDGFLSGLPAGVQLFSLFDANPTLIDLIVDICGTAPALAQHLARNSGVLDAVIGGSFFAPWPGVGPLTADLGRMMDETPDYERKLDTARRWRNEWHFRIGVHHLRGLTDAHQAGKEYADLAEAVVMALFPVVQAEFARKHGAPPGLGAVVLGMGSIGAGRLNAGSDLDLIVIYDDAGVDTSEGPRPLATRPYYARLTQALVTAITAQMPQGRLYEVDMRLRPSGRAGPVATSITAFTQYQEHEAWTWEHLALTRARALAGPIALRDRVEAARQSVLRLKSTNPAILPDVAEMRARLLAHKPGAGAWEAKNGPGRIMDIELLAQTGALLAADPARRVEAQLRAAQKVGLISKADHDTLATCYRLLWRVQAPARLLATGSPDPATMAEGARALVLRETAEATPQTLADRLVSLCDASRAIIDATFAPSQKDSA